MRSGLSSRGAALLASLFLTTTASAAPLPGMPDGAGDYEALVSLYDEFLSWQDSPRAKRLVPNRDIAGAAAERYPDYGDAAVDERRARMRAFQDQLEDFGVAGWPLDQQVDYLAVRSRFDQYDFTLNVSRPWSRDPGFYVDRMLRLTFADVPEDVRRMILGENAASLYNFDLDALKPLAAEIGPRPSQVNAPLPRDEIPRDSMCYLFQNALHGG